MTNGRSMAAGRARLCTASPPGTNRRDARSSSTQALTRAGDSEISCLERSRDNDIALPCAQRSAERVCRRHQPSRRSMSPARGIGGFYISRRGRIDGCGEFSARNRRARMSEFRVSMLISLGEHLGLRHLRGRACWEVGRCAAQPRFDHSGTRQLG